MLLAMANAFDVQITWIICGAAVTVVAMFLAVNLWINR